MISAPNGLCLYELLIDRDVIVTSNILLAEQLTAIYISISILEYTTLHIQAIASRKHF